MWCFHSRRDMGTSEGASHARQPRRPITAQVPASSGVPDVPPAVVGQGQSPPAPGPAAVRGDSVLPWVAAWWFCWWIFTGPGGRGAASGELPSHRKRGLLRGSRRGRGGVISPLPAFTPWPRWPPPARLSSTRIPPRAQPQPSLLLARRAVSLAAFSALWFTFILLDGHCLWAGKRAGGGPCRAGAEQAWPGWAGGAFSCAPAWGSAGTPPDRQVLSPQCRRSQSRCRWRAGPASSSAVTLWPCPPASSARSGTAATRSSTPRATPARSWSWWQVRPRPRPDPSRGCPSVYFFFQAVNNVLITNQSKKRESILNSL